MSRIIKKKERDFTVTNRNWRNIPRADNPEKDLSDRAVHLLSEIVCCIKESDGCAILTHDDISKETNCGRHQNRKILHQLDNILDIKFHHAIAIKGKREFNVFVITLPAKGERLLNLTSDFYEQLGIPYPRREKC